MTNLNLIKRKAKAIANPLPAILLPMGVLILATACIPLNLDLLLRVIVMVVLFAFGVFTTYYVQVYYRKKFGTTIEEDTIASSIAKNAGYLIFIFVTFIIYSLLYAEAWNFPIYGLLAGISGFGIITFLICNSIYLITKEENRSEQLTSYGTLYFCFIALWLLSEFIGFWLSMILWPLLGPALFSIGIWLCTRKKSTSHYAIVGLVLIIFALILHYFTSSFINPIFLFSNPRITSFIEFFLNFDQFRGHWILLGTAILILGIIEHIRLLKLMHEK